MVNNKVYIDISHGGHDRGVPTCDSNWPETRLLKKICDYLIENQDKINAKTFIKDNKTFTNLEDKVKLCNKTNADLNICFHIGCEKDNISSSTIFISSHNTPLDWKKGEIMYNNLNKWNKFTMELQQGYYDYKYSDWFWNRYTDNFSMVIIIGDCNSQEFMLKLREQTQELVDAIIKSINDILELKLKYPKGCKIRPAQIKNEKVIGFITLKGGVHAFKSSASPQSKVKSFGNSFEIYPITDINKHYVLVPTKGYVLKKNVTIM